MPNHADRPPIGLVLLLLTVCAIAPYFGVWNNGFIDYDDVQYITENPSVQQGLTLKSVMWAFRTLAVSNWHPLTWLSHIVDYQLFGLWAGGHHLVSLALHVANTLLLFGVLFRMTASPWRCALVAALFAVHPLHVESVAWIAERKDVLSTFFGFLAIWFYVGYVRRQSVARYLLVFGCFALSLLAKPMLVTLPFVLLLLDVWPLRRLWILDWGGGFWIGPVVNPKSKIHPANPKSIQVIVEKLPLLALSATSAIITVIAQKAGGAVFPLEVLPFGARVANAVVAYVMYMGKMIWPANLAVLYPHPGVWAIELVAGSAVVLMVISAVVGVLSRKRPWLLIGWLWYLGTLVPVIGLLQVGLQSMADRYTYVPLIGVFIMMAWSVPHPSKPRWNLRAAMVVGWTLLLVALGARTLQYVQDWRESQTLFERTLAITGRNFMIRNNLGYALMKKGKTDEAIAEYRKTLDLNWNYAVAHDNLGNALVAKGNLDEAVSHYREALRIWPEFARSHNNLGSAFSRLNRIDEAIVEIQEALRLRPEFAAALVNLGVAYSKQRKYDEAIVQFSRAIELEPNLAKAHAGLGSALASKKKFNDAMVEYSRALQLDPTLHETHVNFGVALATQERLDEAIAHFREAMRLKPDLAEARQFLELAERQKAEESGKP